MYPGPVPGSVEQIHIAAVESELPHRVDEVEVTDEGMVGDRYAASRDITLVEAEALEGLRDDHGIELSPAEVRRQVLTRGIRLNEDLFTIQLRDQSGKFHSIRKSNAEVIRKETGVSLMPSFAGRMSEAELDDLVAYLSSLGGA